MALAGGLASLAFVSGPGGWAMASPSWLVTAAYLCSARVLTECVCRLMPLIVSQLIDEDSVVNG